MRNSWPYLVIFTIGMGILGIGFFFSRSAREENASTVAYFRQIRPIEEELEDVRGNLRSVISGRKAREPIAQVVTDAHEESRVLHAMPDVPAECRSVHQQLMSWSSCLNAAATDAGSLLPNSARAQRIRSSLAQADHIYWKAEMGAASDEH